MVQDEILLFGLCSPHRDPFTLRYTHNEIRVCWTYSIFLLKYANIWLSKPKQIREHEVRQPYRHMYSAQPSEICVYL